MESVGELLEVCSQIVLKCLYLARIGRPDILWSVTHLARSVTKMDSGLRQTFGSHVGNTAKHCRRGLLQDSDFADDFEDSKSTLGGVLCIFLEAEHSVPVRWMCKETNNQFLTAPQGLMLFLWMLDYEWMGYLLLTYGNIVIEVLRTTKDNIQPGHTQGILGRSNPTVPAQGNLSMFNPTG